MNIFKFILAIVGGLILGGIANMSLINLGPTVIPPPAGIDITSYEGLKLAISVMEPRHFIFPFLAHAIGALIGSLTAAFIAPSRKNLISYIIGALFFIGGLSNIILLPSPMWFIAIDLLFAYFPMSFLALKLYEKLNKNE